MSRRTVLPSPVVSLHAQLRLSGPIVVAGGSGSPVRRAEAVRDRSASRRIIDSRRRRCRARPAMASCSSCPPADAAARGRRRRRATPSESVRAGLAAVPADGDDHLRARRGPPVRSARAVRRGDRCGARRRRRGGPRRRGDRHDQARRRRQTWSSARPPGRAWSRCRRRRRSAASALRAAHAGGRDGDRRRGARRSCCGGRVVVVAGEPDNRKITHPDDLAWARQRAGGEGRPMTDVRVGQGFDVHRFSDDPQRGAGARRGRVRRASAACTATATPMSSPTRSPMRCSVLPASATSASTFPTPIRGGRTPTRWCCSRHCGHTGASRWLDHRQRRLLSGVRDAEAGAAPGRDADQPEPQLWSAGHREGPTSPKGWAHSGVKKALPAGR